MESDGEVPTPWNSVITVIAFGLFRTSSVKVVTAPAVVIRPIELWPFVNQRLPSGPVVIDDGASTPAPVKLVALPVVVMRPIVRS
jgi:hypothetical protein